MTLGRLDYYLIIINIIGFVLYLINMWLYNSTEDGQIDRVLTIVSVLGGSLGICLAIALFDRKSVKDNMMSRVFVVAVLIIQIVLYLIIKGQIKSEITLKFWSYFGQHKALVSYLLVINIVAMVLYGIDKIAAIEHRSRIRIITLLGIALAGGSIGALVAMYLFHHKTRQDYFAIGVPLIMVAQGFILFYLMNGKIG